MARSVKQDEYENRRNQILEAAQRLVYTRGYEQMSIQDVLTEVHISKGAFYHYFDSKQALLEALIERMTQEVIQYLKPIAEDDHLGAAEKLMRVFDAASRWKTDRKEMLLAVVNVWYADENAILRLKVQSAALPSLARMITGIVCQGVQEGIFHTNYPDQISWIVFSLLQNFGDAMIPMILQHETNPKALENLEMLSASHQEAVERILGAEKGSLPLFDTRILREWFTPSIST